MPSTSISREEINAKILEKGAGKLNLAVSASGRVQDLLGRIAKRFSDADGPFHETLMDELESPFRDDRFAALKKYKTH